MTDLGNPPVLVELWFFSDLAKEGVSYAALSWGVEEEEMYYWVEEEIVQKHLKVEPDMNFFYVYYDADEELVSV